MVEMIDVSVRINYSLFISKMRSPRFTKSEVEIHTGRVIVETIKKCGYNVLDFLKVIVKKRGLSFWVDATDCLYNFIAI